MSDNDTPVQKTEDFIAKHEKAIVIGAVVALFVFIGYLVSTL